MDTSGYTSHGARTAVALVNAVSAGPTVPELTEVLGEYEFAGTPGPGDLRGLRDWSAKLRRVFTANGVDDATAVLNALLGEVTARPRIADHDEKGPHLHYVSASAPLVDRVRACTAMGLATLVCDYGMSRLGVCCAAACGRVFVDTSRNARRRFCSSACANRTNVAAYRSRQSAGIAGAGSRRDSR